MSLRQDILAHFDYWRPVLGLEGWAIELHFGERKLKGYCIVESQYLQATLGFNLKRVKAEVLKRSKLQLGFDPLEELVLHEMVHVLNPRSSERAISQTTYSLLRARAKGA